MGREVHKGGDICICIADPLCCTVETVIVNNYTPIKINLKKKEKGIYQHRNHRTHKERSQGFVGRNRGKGERYFFKEMNSVVKFRINWSKNLAANNTGGNEC